MAEIYIYLRCGATASRAIQRLRALFPNIAATGPPLCRNIRAVLSFMVEILGWGPRPNARAQLSFRGEKQGANTPSDQYKSGVIL